MPFPRSPHLLLIAALAVPAGLFGAAAVHNRAEVLRTGMEAAVRTAAAMDEHARKVFETGELVLDRVEDRVRGLDDAAIRAPATSAFLARLKAPLEQVVSIWLMDADGLVMAGSQGWSGGLSLAGRDVFDAPRDGFAGTYVSSVFRSRMTGVTGFAISRRRETADGRFAGTVHISFSPAYFARIYADGSPRLAHSAALVRVDGKILAREPYRDTNLVLPATSPLMGELERGVVAGSMFAVSGVDGLERAYAFRKVGAYPVYVGFGIETSALLARWHGNLVGFGLAAALGSAMLLAVSWLAMRSLGREKASMARLQTALTALEQETAQRREAEGRMIQTQKMEAVGQLTGGIAHDFNNLLTAVLGSLELLGKVLGKRPQAGDVPGDGAQVRSLLDTATRGAQRGASLTQRLLAFSRRQMLRPEPVDLAVLVADMSGLLQTSVGDGVTLRVEVAADLAAVQADEHQLELALVNLAVNGRDAMAGHGTMTIEGLLATEGERVAAGLAPGAYVRVRVTDTGAGMDAATLSRCVEPFFTTKEVGRGSGLGLSMVHGFAEQSEGRLELQSRVGHGTTAVLWLPRAVGGVARKPSTALPDPPLGAPGPVPAAPAAVAAVPVGERLGRGLTLLVVDDDPLVLESLAGMLEDMGHGVATAGSGAEALGMLEAGLKGGLRPDLMLTDYSMPDMSGVEVALAARRLAPGFPVLLVTGFAERGDILDSGLPVLLKPFAQAAMARAIAECLSRVLVSA